MYHELVKEKTEKPKRKKPDRGKNSENGRMELHRQAWKKAKKETKGAASRAAMSKRKQKNVVKENKGSHR